MTDKVKSIEVIWEPGWYKGEVETGWSSDGIKFEGELLKDGAVVKVLPLIYVVASAGYTGTGEYVPPNTPVSIWALVPAVEADTLALKAYDVDREHHILVNGKRVGKVTYGNDIWKDYEMNIPTPFPWLLVIGAGALIALIIKRRR